MRCLNHLLCITLLALPLVQACDDSSTTEPPAGQSVCLKSFGQELGSSPMAVRSDDRGPISAKYRVNVDLTHAALSGEQREPQYAPVTVETLEGDWVGTAAAKRYALSPEKLWLELYFENDAEVGAQELVMTVSQLQGSLSVHDIAQDPMAGEAASTSFTLPGIAPFGATRGLVGFTVSEESEELSFEVEISGEKTKRIAVASAPLAITPNGQELWVTSPDTDQLFVVDTEEQTKKATLDLKGRPVGVAIDPDSRFALVACETCNQVVVFDIASRKAIQAFGESDGLKRSPEHIVHSDDGRFAVVSSRVGDALTIFRRGEDGYQLTATVPVGRRPMGLSIAPDGETIYVSHFLPRGKIQDNGSWLTIVNAERGEVVREVDLKDDANLTGAQCLQKVGVFNDVEPEQLIFEASPTQLAGVFLSPGGGRGLVPGLRLSGFPIFEGDTTRIDLPLLTKGANSPAMLFTLDARTIQEAQFPRAPVVIDVTDRDQEFLNCFPLSEAAEAITPKEGPSEIEPGYPGVTAPSGSTQLAATGTVRHIAWSRGGRRSLALSYIADHLVVMDGVTGSPTSRNHLVLSGHNPTGLAVSPSGDRAYVMYENSLELSVLDLSEINDELPSVMMVPYRFIEPVAQGATLVTFKNLARNITNVPELPRVKEVGQITLLEEDYLDPVMRRGKILFTSSNPQKFPELSTSPQAACAACHPNGGTDGSVWSTMEGERRTSGLWGGTGRRGWLHFSATHPDATDFATTIVTERLGGTGLSESDVHALSYFISWGIPTRQLPKVDPESAARGEVIFNQYCLSCHSGPDYGSGLPDLDHPYGKGSEDGPVLYDLGTAVDWAQVGPLSTAFTRLFPPITREVMNALRGDRDLGPDDLVQERLNFSPRPQRDRGSFKAPSLINLYENSTFMHDGRFHNLGQVVDFFDTYLSMGLSTTDREDLINFLKTL